MSTRSDVERLLGMPPPEWAIGSQEPKTDKAYSIYSLPEGEAQFYFADENSSAEAKCGPAVAAGTVLLIRFTPKDETLVSKLNLDERRLRKFDPGAGREAFIDEHNGLLVTASDGKVTEFVCLASAVDRPRCPSYYEDAERFVRAGVACGLRFDEYGDLRFEDEKARLDNFAIQLMNMEDASGYIVAYAGRKAIAAEAQLRLNRAKGYLVNVRGISPERVITIDGGHREDLSVLLHIAPEGTGPPEVSPTVDLREVEIIYEKKRRPRR